MRRVQKDLSAIAIKELVKKGLHAVGTVSGLNLKIDSNGNKSWVLRVLVGGRRRSMGLGGYPSVPLALACQKARDARKLIDDGVDPIQARKKSKLELRTITFAEAAERYICAKEPEWRNLKHAQQWRNTINHYAKSIKTLPVSEISTQHIVDLLDEIWLQKNETASRLRGRIESILDWAATRKYRHGENPARWRGHLENLLASPRKINRFKKHHEAIDWRDISSFMPELIQHQTVTSTAMQFTILTAGRTAEIVGAMWDEFDFEKNIWTIPGHRMKNGKVHRVALSSKAIELLNSLSKDSKYVFPGNKGKCLSNMAMLTLLKRMNKTFTVHGFRSTFRVWAADNTNYPKDVCESALSHSTGSSVELSYKRTDFIERRFQLMEDWANFVFNFTHPGDSRNG